MGQNKIRLLGKILARQSGHQVRSTNDELMNTLIIDYPESPATRSLKYINLPDNFQFTKGFIENKNSLGSADRQGQYIVTDKSSIATADKYLDLPGDLNADGTYSKSSSGFGVLLVNENSTINPTTGARVTPTFINQTMINGSGKIFIRTIT